MRTVYKYPLEWWSPQVVRMPEGATILKVGVQADTPFIMAEVDTEQISEDRYICIHGTGDTIEPMADRYLGTIHKGEFVFHIYECTMAGLRKEIK